MNFFLLIPQKEGNTPTLFITGYRMQEFAGAWLKN
jgi:hypothetical protein